MTTLSSLYESDQWASRKAFIHYINGICAEQDISITWLSGHWIARLQKGDAYFYIQAYTFPLNSIVAGMIINDKTATYEVLTQQNIPAIIHRIVRPSETPDTNLTDAVMQLSPLPIVIKPNSNSGGRGVFKCETRANVETALAELSLSEKLIAVGPLVPISREFRVLILDGVARLLYEKQRQPGAWHHNLRHGATPVAVTDSALSTRITHLAQRTMQVLKARIGAVDVVETPDGLAVLEVNGGITLSHFGAHSPANDAAARAIYAEIIEKCWHLC